MLDYKILGQRIKSARTAAGYTQERLAEKADLSTDHLSHLSKVCQRDGVAVIFSELSVFSHIAVRLINKLCSFLNFHKYASLQSRCSWHKITPFGNSYHVLCRISIL